MAPPKILIVDDLPSNLMAAEAALAPLGHQIVLARSGEDALRRLLEDDFAVVILDVMMSDISGFEVARIMRTRDKTRATPVIFLTAREPTAADLMQSYAHHAVDFLAKPFDLDLLRVKVTVFVELYLSRETARRLAREEEQLRSAERERRQLELLLMNAPVAVALVKGSDHHIELCNERFRRLARAASSLAGQRLADVFRELGESALLRLFDGVRASGQARSVSAMRLTLEGRGDGSAEEYFDVSIEPLVDGHDESDVRLACSVVDVTEHVRARRLRDDFLSVASHELKTPLTTLHLQADLLEKHASSGGCFCASVAAKVPIVRKQIGRLERLVEELLDVSRIAAGKLPVTLEPMELGAVTTEVVERLADEARKAGCPITLDVATRVEGRWDRMRVEHVVTNLLTNAIKYGAGKPVAVRVDGDDATARLSVSDHGIGIAAKDHKRIFQRFERAVEQRSFGGVGVGLWIVAQFAGDLGGSVSVASQPGAGATFTVELPRAGGKQ